MPINRLCYDVLREIFSYFPIFVNDGDAKKSDRVRSLIQLRSVNLQFKTLIHDRFIEVICARYGFNIDEVCFDEALFRSFVEVSLFYNDYFAIPRNYGVDDYQFSPCIEYTSYKIFENFYYYASAYHMEPILNKECLKIVLGISLTNIENWNIESFFKKFQKKVSLLKPVFVFSQ